MFKISKVKFCVVVAVALILTILYPSPFASAATVSPDTLTPESIQQYSVASQDLVDGAFKELSAQLSGKSKNYSTGGAVNFVTDYMLEHPTITAGEPTFTIPTYSFWQGKQLITYRFQDLVEHQILVECTFVLVNQPLEPSASFIHYDGIDYVPNAVNIAIYREDGSVNRYYITGGGTSKKALVSTSYITWELGFNPSTVVPVSGSGERYDNITLITPIKVYLPDVNSINNTLWEGDATHENFILGFYNSDTGNEPVDYLSDLSILKGSARMAVRRTDDPSRIDAKTKNIATYYASWIDSNDSGWNRYYTDKRQFSYNSYFVGGTTINNSNYTNYYGGALAPLFSPDIDWSLPDLDIPALIGDLLPDLKTTLSPQLDWVNNSLDAKINTYLQSMPDFGFEWGVGSQIDYLQVFNPLPPVTSGGSGGGCNWVTPTYPAYDESTNIVATYPSLPTNTLPQNFIDNAKDVFQGGYDFMNALGLIAVIIPVALFGILWKFTGG